MTLARVLTAGSDGRIWKAVELRYSQGQERFLHVPAAIVHRVPARRAGSRPTIPGCLLAAYRWRSASTESGCVRAWARAALARPPCRPRWDWGWPRVGARWWL